MRRFQMTLLFAILQIPGPNLLLRDYGRRAFPFLEQALEEVPAGQMLTLVFVDITVMDTSFAEETVIELASRLIQGKYGDRMVLLDQPTPATIDNLEGGMARLRTKLALLIRENEEIRLIGHVEPNLIETWRLVYQKGELTARMLADFLGLEINTASMRLHKLYKARLLLRREEITSEGRQHVYVLPL